MTDLTLSQKIRALYYGQELSLAGWEHDFVRDAYATSLGGEKPFHLTQKQQENIEVIFQRVYQ
jgi:hypothetical protein